MQLNGLPIKSFLADVEGSMTVEFVVTVPMLILALTFTFEFARALWAYDVMTRDVRGAMRYYARLTGSVSSPCTIPTAVQNVVTTGVTSGGTNHFPWNVGTPGFSCGVTNFNSGFNQAASVVTMTATVPVSIYFMTVINSFAQGSAVAASYTLSVSDQIRMAGN